MVYGGATINGGVEDYYITPGHRASQSQQVAYTYWSTTYFTTNHAYYTSRVSVNGIEHAQRMELDKDEYNSSRVVGPCIRHRKG